VRQEFAELRAVLADLLELELRAEQLGIRVNEGGPVVLEQFRRRQGAVELGELRLVVEQFEVARGAAHEQVDDALGLGREVRRRGGLLAEQPVERDRAEPDGAIAKEPAARDQSRNGCHWESHGAFLGLLLLFVASFRPTSARRSSSEWASTQACRSRA